MSVHIPLTWRECEIKIWERMRPCSQAGGFLGGYIIGRIERDTEHPVMQTLLGIAGMAELATVYRAEYLSAGLVPDQQRMRYDQFSDFFKTEEEAKQWCQKLEDDYRTKWNEMGPHREAGAGK